MTDAALWSLWSSGQASLRVRHRALVVVVVGHLTVSGRVAGGNRVGSAACGDESVASFRHLTSNIVREFGT